MAQRQWTIECRADFADPEKNDFVTAAVKRAAVHINAQGALISDDVKFQVVCFSDDFFAGHQVISLIQDELGSALQHASMSEGEEEQVSKEMLDAVRALESKS